LDETEEQVWIFPIDGSEPYALTDIDGGVQEHQWAPDGRSILVLTLDEAGAGSFWRYPVPDGERELVFRHDQGMDSFAMSPDGQSVAFRSKAAATGDDAEDYEVYVLDISRKKTRRVTQRGGVESDIGWTSDSRGLVVTAPQFDTLDFSQREVFTIPLIDFPLEDDPIPPNLWVQWTDKFDRDVEQILWPSAYGDAYVIAHDGTSCRLAMLNREGGIDWLTDDDEIVRSGAISHDGQWMAITIESQESAPRLLLVDQDGDARRTLANPNRETFAGVRPAKQEVFRWTSRDGLPVEGILVHPWWKDATPPHPLIVYLHGGPSRHVTGRLLHEPQIWAGWGYMVLAPNYRGSAGHGNEFSTANLRDPGGGDLDDVLTGVDRLIEAGLADPGRLAILGGSYGGYITNRAVSHTERFAAAASEDGILSLIAESRNSFPGQWETSYPWEHSRKSAESYLQRSPAFEADRITTPVMILHGEEGENAFTSNSLDMYNVLDRLDGAVKLHTFPRGQRRFYEPGQVLEEMRLIQDWFDRHVTRGPLWPSEYSRLQDMLPEHLPPALSELMRNTDRLPRLHRVGDTLRVGRGSPMTAVITSIESSEAYGPERAVGRFLTVSFLFSQEGEGGSGLQLGWDDLALLEPTGRARHPVGIPQKAHGKVTLVRTQDFVFRISPQPESKNHWLPLSVTFDLPEGRHAVPLIVGPFPPTLISLGEAVGHE
jgi:dipeptidyl aminopeptidase/acylaminoacyl peptidase